VTIENEKIIVRILHNPHIFIIPIIQEWIKMICYEYINDYIRKTIKKTKVLAELEEFAKENHVPIVHPEVASLLRVIGLTLRPSRVLEVGTAIGYSAILFSTFLEPGGRIDTIDRYELMLEKPEPMLKKPDFRM